MIITTLVEGDYIFGAIALVNSLRKVGCELDIHVGLVGAEKSAFKTDSGVVLHLLSAKEREAHNRKCELIKTLDHDDFIFIDADCIITSNDFINDAIRIVERMPLLCVDSILPAKDIRRIAWNDAYRNVFGHIQQRNCSDIYYNSGFFGGKLTRDAQFYSRWTQLMESQLSGRGKAFETRMFPMIDQDCLNAVAQNYEGEFAVVGPPDVWYAANSAQPFLHVGIERAPALLHQTGQSKPWRIKTVPPRSPNPYEREWYSLVNSDSSCSQLRHNCPPSVDEWFRGTLNGRARARLAGLGRRFQRMWS